GKMLLSALPEDALDAHYPRDAALAGMTANSIVSSAQLRTHLEEVRQAGVAYDDCESNEAVRCVSAGVRDHTGRMVAAMSISVPTIRWTDARSSQWAELI